MAGITVLAVLAMGLSACSSGSAATTTSPTTTVSATTVPTTTVATSSSATGVSPATNASATTTGTSSDPTGERREFMFQVMNYQTANQGGQIINLYFHYRYQSQTTDLVALPHPESTVRAVMPTTGGISG